MHAMQVYVTGSFRIWGPGVVPSEGNSLESIFQFCSRQIAMFNLLLETAALPQRIRWVMSSDEPYSRYQVLAQSRL